MRWHIVNPFVDNFPPEERLLAIHNFYLVKAAVLILFYGLLRFSEIYKIEVRDGGLRLRFKS
jgi:hypothetical protein